MYLARRRKWIIMLLGVVALFILCFYLYHLPLKAVLYPCTLAFFVIALMFIDDYHRLQKRCDALLNLDARYSPLPEALNESEEGYRFLMEHLRQQLAQTEEQTRQRYQDTVEYYTMWVHQVKTPIAAMKLQLSQVDSALARGLDTDLKRIEQYVEMVLAYLKLEDGMKDYVLREHDLDTIIRQSVKGLSKTFILKGLQLIYEPTQIKVVTDEKWCGFILDQLLSNALKYTKEGTVHLYAPSAQVLCIEDSGIGIRADDLPRIFELGYTGYNGRMDKRATGLGLYLCARIAKNLGITLTVESTVGQGTKMCLHFNQDNHMIEENKWLYGEQS